MRKDHYHLKLTKMKMKIYPRIIMKI